jgi:hypothetical protein
MDKYQEAALNHEAMMLALQDMICNGQDRTGKYQDICILASDIWHLLSKKERKFQTNLMEKFWKEHPDSMDTY